MNRPFVFLLLLLASCSGVRQDQKPFDRYFDFSAEIKRLEGVNPVIEKIVIANGQEEKIVDTVDWGKELAPFLEADINKHSLVDSYNRSSSRSETREVVLYKAKDADLDVQETELVFEGGTCKQVKIICTNKNALYQSYQELVYVPNSHYSIQGSQIVNVAMDAHFEVIGRFLQPENIWRGALALEDAGLPFNFELMKKEDGSLSMTIRNGDERIVAKDISIIDDSIRISLPVFDSEFKGLITETSISGHWHNYSKGPDYAIPFNATKGVNYRFKPSASAQPKDFSGRWEVLFSPESDKPCFAIGEFTQSDSKVTGTFITETGDYRFLEGEVRNDTMWLSTFDGAHAFLFRGVLNDANSSVSGTFWSGTHWKESWVAEKNEKATLTHPDSLTYLKPGYDKFAFSFPDLDSQIVSLSDPKFQGKVVIVDIMGSWCPNCMDETVYLNDLHAKYKDKGLEIVALAYEKSADFQIAKKSVLKHSSSLNAQYPFLIAGVANKKLAAESLPMLNHILSFPTTLFIDRSGNVRKIYTGFYGPGTGQHYNRFQQTTSEFVESLLMEKTPEDYQLISGTSK